MSGTISGAGTEGNPYIIEDEADLMAFANSANSEKYWVSGIYAQLGGDISVSSITWTPIGIDDTNAYQGTFDGAGHTVTFESAILIESSCHGGFFGYISGAVVQNLGVNWKVGLSVKLNYDILGTYVGGIVGYASAGTIFRCRNISQGELYAQNHSDSLVYIGGIVGYGGATVSQCYNEGNIKGYSNRGESHPCACGIGYANSIINCYNRGTISCKTDDGAGNVYGIGYATTIANSYNIGALVVDARGTANLYLGNSSLDCFSAVESAEAIDITGGVAENFYVITNGYYNYPNDNGDGNDVDLISKLAGTQNIINYTSEGVLDWTNDWDIALLSDTASNSVWTIIDGENGGFPVLRAFYTVPSATINIYAQENSDAIIYLVVDDAITNQAVLSGALTFSVPQTAGSVRFIVSTKNYFTQVGYQDNDNLDFSNGYKNVKLLQVVDTDIYITITASMKNFNNSIVV